jgi:2,4-dienoyl-CoA reductase-like NADH-dependent reductase (Old Yellow Enzyme family)
MSQNTESEMKQPEPSATARTGSDNPILQPLRFPKVRKEQEPDGKMKLIVSPGAGLEVKNRIFRSSISGTFDYPNGTGAEPRIRWEEQFARGGVGAIISSFVPVRLDGRILPRYALIHKDETVKFWNHVARRVEKAGKDRDGKECKYIMQLSHGGRQRDVPGVENFMSLSKSSTSQADSFHGLLARAMTITEIETLIEDFGKAARRAQEAGVHGVELHSSHGYLFTQFLSSAINDRKDQYGGPVAQFNEKGEVVGGRVKLLVDVIASIREHVGWDYHVQAKLNIIDRNRAYFPLEWKDGNKLAEALQIFEIAESAGLNGLHVSGGSTFPHPLVPPGGFPLDEGAWWYGVMAGSGTRAFSNLTLFHFPWLRWIFRLLWNRVKKEFPIEGVTGGLCKLVREAALERAQARGNKVTAEEAKSGATAHIPVLNTGGYQDGALIRRYINEGHLDGVAIARPLIANKNLVEFFEKGQDLPDRPCTFCNRCLLNALANPLSCYDLSRFMSAEDWKAFMEEGDPERRELISREGRERMVAEAMSVFPKQYEPICPDETAHH